jgi:apolipoprotein D and lipocalin family protein
MRLSLEQYSGRWYEAARLPNEFEKGCESATADYIKSGKFLIVVNTCYNKNSVIYQTVGKAIPKDDYLEVKFLYNMSKNEATVISPPPAEYIVLWTDYDNISLVTTRDRKNAWILTRKQEITKDQKKFSEAKMKKYNVDVSRLIY